MMPRRRRQTSLPSSGKAYTQKDIRESLDLKQRSEAGGFVTTEKDAINLGPYLSALEPLR